MKSTTSLDVVYNHEEQGRAMQKITPKGEKNEFKKMMEIYKNYGKSVETENMFYMMYEHGIISTKTWRKFIKETSKEN